MPKRRQFSPEFKARVVLEVVSGAKSAAEVCREHSLKPDLLSRWKAEFLANAGKVFERGEAADPQQARIAELERLAGKLSLELEVAHMPWRAVPGKKASTLLRSAASRSDS